MQDIRDFESGIDKVQVGIFGPPSPGTAATSVNDLAYAVKDALEIAYQDNHKDMLLLPQGSMLWNEHGTAWTGERLPGGHRRRGDRGTVHLGHPRRGRHVPLYRRPGSRRHGWA